MTKRQTFGDRMVVLKSERHERYAQGLAKGKTQEEAYEEAGYKPHRSSASRLRTNANISARVSNILEKAAVRAEISVAGLTDRLMGIADKGEVLADAAGLSVARLSLMDAAKLNGLVIDKAEIDGRFLDVTAEPEDHDEAVAKFVADLERDGIDVN